jgi:hypothetical protein
MSSFGSTNPTVSPLIDNLGRAWTIAQDGRILINGAPAAGGGGDLLVWWSDAVMYARNSTWPDSNGSWWKWDNAEAAWKVSSDPRIPPPPPPSHPELCAADGTGNGIDEDMDGLTDEDCKPAPTPPDTAAPEVSLVIGRRTGNNYPVTITTDDDSGIDHVEVLVDGVLQVRMQLPTSGCCTWATKVLIKASGTHTITAKAWDPAGNKGEASATVKR